MRGKPLCRLPHFDLPRRTRPVSLVPDENWPPSSALSHSMVSCFKASVLAPQEPSPVEGMFACDPDAVIFVNFSPPNTGFLEP